MKNRDYYSVRTGKVTSKEIDLEVLKKMFLVMYNKLANEEYFQKYFGKDCVDGYISGVLGDNIADAMFISLRKENLYPIKENVQNYTEDDLFDVIEFLHDNCSKGIGGGYYHSFCNCGYHYDKFDDQAGRQHFRESINSIIKDYKNGFEISEAGEILMLSDNGLSNLLEADIPTTDKENITNKIEAAITKFRRYKSTLDDRRDAVRELVDVLEFLRTDIKEILTKKDEADIFNIANNFGIRHHNSEQKIDYDKSIWHSWMFYYYLATIHAVLRMKEKKEHDSAVVITIDK